MFVAGRRPSLPRLVLSVIVSQFLFHTLFGLGAGTQGAGLTLHAVGHHGQFIVVSSTSASRPLAHTGIDVTMWAGHAVAAIITVFALHFGERMLLLLRGIAEQVRAWWGRRVQTCQHPLAFLALRPMPTDGIPSSTALRLLAGSLLRRGPPPHRRPLLSHLTIS
ncbi:hypothetical protein [Microbacterium hydrocarbonoxydans]|nr:hypothetical protein [Microbacterium hydrocarbonoxydans]